MLIVAFGYGKRTGKDTSGKFLDSYLKCEKPGLKVRRVSFANPLKDISYQLYGWAGLQSALFYETPEGAELKEVVLPKIGLSPRKIWIMVGNKMREIYPDTWLNKALLAVEADVLIICDLRFQNEGDKVNELGGWCYEMIRDDVPKGHDAAEVDLTKWGGFKGQIDNNGTLKELHDRIEILGAEVLAAL